MRTALIGLPQTGKKTLFSLLTGIPYQHLLARSTDYHVGTVKVADPRVDRLSAMYHPQRTKYAEIELTLAPAPPTETKARDQWLQKLKDMDALAHVVRAFADPAVFHPAGSVNPARDIEQMNLELTISDLALIETRLTRIAQDQKRKPDPDRADEAALLQRLKPHLESGQPLRTYPWQPAEEKRIRSLQLLTLKPIVTILNTDESNTATAPDDPLTCRLNAKLEAEIAEIENPAERAEFLAALGIREPALHQLTRLLYRALGYISFFTVGPDEVRAWSIRHGATAVEAAHAIHSDLARGFIRAEVMKYDELIAAGSDGHKAEVHLKETGRLLLKGRDYVVEDGDIVHIRHSS
ncbi:MAG: YchF family ATPase [Verrucomicrobiae bacterium]|nr:YchF family ATPase [Verrucomicrobiae bacterium]